MRSLRSNTKKQNCNEKTEIFLPSDFYGTITTVIDEEKPIKQNEKTPVELGKKCGEIFTNKDEDFSYLCTICGTILEGLEKFISHIKIHSNFWEKENVLEEPQIKFDPDKKTINKEIEINKNNDNTLNEQIDDKEPKANKNLNIKKNKRNNKIDLICKLCNKQFSSKVYLDSHLNYDHADPNPFKITTHNQPDQSSDDDDNDEDYDIDGDNLDDTDKLIKKKKIRKQTTEEKEFLEKLDKLIEQDPLKCRYCRKRLRSRMERFEHECKHTGEKPYKCEICGSGFRKKCVLDEHLIIHKDERPFNCEICNLKVKTKKYLRIHMRIHSGIKPYKCRYCDKTFVQGGSRNSHERTHTNEKRYQCPDCGKCFGSGCGFHRHVRKHRGLKPHKCGYCGKAYVELHDMRHHEKVHIGERPYVCKVCDARYTTYRGLKLHIKAHPEITEDDIDRNPTTLFTSTSTTENLEKTNSTCPESVTPIDSVEIENDKNISTSSSTFLSTTDTIDCNNKQSSTLSSLYPMVQGALNMSMPNPFGVFPFPLSSAYPQRM